MEDDELTDRWEAGLDRSISHREHVQIARVLLLRHESQEAERRLLAGTRLNCALAGVPERFDADLTSRWTRLIAAALETHGPLELDALLEQAPELVESRRLGDPPR